MVSFSLLRSRNDGGPRACRSGLSGVLEDLYGSLSTSDFYQIEKAGAGDKMDVLVVT